MRYVHVPECHFGWIFYSSLILFKHHTESLRVELQATLILAVVKMCYVLGTFLFYVSLPFL